MKTFRAANILIPVGCDMEKWSVIACDQFTSQPEYWRNLEELVGEAPSTLRLMLPEAYLETKDQFEEAQKINRKMKNFFIQKEMSIIILQI